MSSSVEVREIVYHCECSRFVEGTPASPCTCFECGMEHDPGEVFVSQQLMDPAD